ncbi:MAG TPA: glycoside hydrolase family 5 protein [Polyangiaceae bacterium]|jgi:endoglucanase|nr:glycoside hydrolase family 5 protein [Polyangiaceae bacterium]
MRCSSLAWLCCALATACISSPPRAPAAQANARTPASLLAPSHSVAEVPPDVVSVLSEPVPGFMHGINLGDALEAPSEGAWGVVLKPAHFIMAKAAGLDHVRLPVKFSAHAAAQAPYTIDEAFFDRVDWALGQAKANGLSIIVDLHHYEELMKQPREHADRLVGLWRQIAARYQGQPASVAFELINEPCDELKSAELNPITAQALAAVRATNPTRLVFADSYFWANAERLKELELPEDANLVPSFHMYQPILFTHQGMPWMGPEFQTRGIVFPGPPAAQVTPVPAAQSSAWASDWFSAYNTSPIVRNSNGPQAIFDYFKLVDDYVASSHRRVYMGEFGVSDSADPASRENWLRLVKREADRRQIGWALWDDGGRFKAMNVADGTWVAPVQAGLFR